MITPTGPETNKTIMKHLTINSFNGRCIRPGRCNLPNRRSPFTTRTSPSCATPCRSTCKSGVNTVRYAGATAQVEPDSVILRDPAGKHSLQILEQNYRNDPVSQELLLSLFEGKTIDFEKIADEGQHAERANSFPAKSSAAATCPAARRSSPSSR